MSCICKKIIFKGSRSKQLVEDFVQFMEEHSEVKCLHVLNWQGYGTEESSYKGFKQIPVGHPYRMSCQAALWRKEELLEILADNESGWDTEKVRFSSFIKTRAYVPGS